VQLQFAKEPQVFDLSLALAQKLACAKAIFSLRQSNIPLAYRQAEYFSVLIINNLKEPRALYGMLFKQDGPENFAPKSKREPACEGRGKLFLALFRSTAEYAADSSCRKF